MPEQNIGAIGSGSIVVYRRSPTTGDLELAFEVGSPEVELSGNFGAAVLGIGDRTGDGVGEIVVGMPRYHQNDLGRAFVLSGADGALVETLSAVPFQPTGQYGSHLARIPDVNGDGIDDLAVGSAKPPSSFDPNPGGNVYVYSGAAFTPLYALFTVEPSSDFATDICGLADLDGDGAGEIAVGAPAGAGGRGAVHVFSGAAGTLLGTIEGLDDGSGFGASVSAVPDTTGDGLNDLLVGAPLDGIPGSHFGRAYLVDGATLQILSPISSPNPKHLGRFAGSIPPGVRVDAA